MKPRSLISVAIASILLAGCEEEKPKNILFCFGDGMGMTTMTAARKILRGVISKDMHKKNSDFLD
jgi:alkaline phosphatase